MGLSLWIRLIQPTAADPRDGIERLFAEDPVERGLVQAAWQRVKVGGRLDEPCLR